MYWTKKSYDSFSIKVRVIDIKDRWKSMRSIISLSKGLQETTLLCGRSGLHLDDHIFLEENKSVVHSPEPCTATAKQYLS